MAKNHFTPLNFMLVMLAYDTPEQRHQTFLRKEFERVGGARVQYSLYLFNGEPHECERVIRYMQRVAKGIPGGQRQLFLSTGDNYFFPVDWVNSFICLAL